MSNELIKSRMVFLLIVAFFVVPFILAAYYHNKAQQGDVWATTNNGTLVHPAHPLDEFNLQTIDEQAFTLDEMRGEWTMLFISDAECLEACKKTVATMQKIWALLNKDSRRVRRLLLSANELDDDMKAFIGGYPKMLVSVDNEKALIGQLPALQNIAEPVVYLIDPIGNVMMAFPQSLDAGKIFKDIRKLLKISKVG